MSSTEIVSINELFSKHPIRITGTNENPYIYAIDLAELLDINKETRRRFVKNLHDEDKLTQDQKKSLGIKTYRRAASGALIEDDRLDLLTEDGAYRMIYYATNGKKSNILRKQLNSILKKHRRGEQTEIRITQPHEFAEKDSQYQKQLKEQQEHYENILQQKDETILIQKEENIILKKGNKELSVCNTNILTGYRSVQQIYRIVRERYAEDNTFGLVYAIQKRTKGTMKDLLPRNGKFTTENVEKQTYEYVTKFCYDLSDADIDKGFKTAVTYRGYKDDIMKEMKAKANLDGYTVYNLAGIKKNIHPFFIKTTNIIYSIEHSRHSMEITDYTVGMIWD